ncbi:AAA family ATPase, partial [Myxococcota bacterium]|nr:AAA family ATPase [Myxococcota bacterium]
GGRAMEGDSSSTREASTGTGRAGPRVLSLVNQKGGCGKTTTTVNLAGALCAQGARVLVIDIDPQAHATLALGIDPDELSENLREILNAPHGPRDLGQILIHVSDGIDLAPASLALPALGHNVSFKQTTAKTRRLKSLINALPNTHDFVLIDCPPALNLLTLNALRASTDVIVPLEASFFAVDGVQKLLQTIGHLEERIGHSLNARVLPTLFDARTRYARETLRDIRALFSEQCFETVIRQNVKLQEAARHGLPIHLYAPSTPGAEDYAAAAAEFTTGRTSESSNRQPRAKRCGIKPIPKREVLIQFQDERAGDVRVAGDFNGWVPDKNVASRVEVKGPGRVWTKVLKLAPGTYQYRCVIDGQWCIDPGNPDSVAGPMGHPNSVLHVR